MFAQPHRGRAWGGCPKPKRAFRFGSQLLLVRLPGGGFGLIKREDRRAAFARRSILDVAQNGGQVQLRRRRPMLIGKIRYRHRVPRSGPSSNWWRRRSCAPNSAPAHGLPASRVRRYPTAPTRRRRSAVAAMHARLGATLGLYLDMKDDEQLKSNRMAGERFAFYEFFAGGGMARLGLGGPWECTFSNERCPKKAASYRARFGNSELRVCDVADLTADDLPGTPTLTWASFPCQDLSLAGNGAGLAGERSGTFKPFWNLMRGMIGLGRIPQIIVLENVVGALTSHGGRDFATIVGALAHGGYRVGALVIDAARFLPQSRPRLFIVGVHEDIPVPPQLALAQASEPWHPKALRNAFGGLPKRLQDAWNWWPLPVPAEPIACWQSN